MDFDPVPLLRKASLFTSCAKEDIKEIASVCGISSYDDGDPVFEAGEPAERLYIVHTGEVVIRKDDDEGHAVDIARFLPGDFFGELDMFLGSPRNASAVADGQVSLLKFPSDGRTFGSLPEMSLSTSAALFHSFLVQISSRIRDVNSLVKENSPVVRELKKQVYVDKLTGLNNRTYFDEVLEEVISANERVGLLLYKPDNFKIINDSHGHEAGDRVLRFIAERLRDFVEDSDMLFRYMGNENAVILPGGDRDELISLADRLGTLLRELDLTPALGHGDIRLSVSFGLALFPDHAGSARSLSETAHPLTLEGRRRGGNMCLFPEDSEEV